MNQAIFESWLMLQCRVVPDARLALARIDVPSAARHQLCARLPANTTDADELEEMRRLAQRGGRTVVAGGSGDLGLRLACPLLAAGQTIGAIVLELKHGDPAQQHKILPILRWGNHWLELLLHRPEAAEAGGDDGVHMLLPVLQATSFHQAVMTLVGRLAHDYGAERVSFGLLQKNRVQPLVLSDSSSLSARSALARQLELAMGEALEQNEPICWPGPGEVALPAHRALAEAHGDTGLLSIRLPGVDTDFGVLTLETTAANGFSDRQQQSIVRLASLLGAVLELKRTRERSLRERIGARLRSGTARHRTLTAFLSLAGGAMLLIWLLGSAVYRVGGGAELQGAVQRALTAPFDGYVEEAWARAGERVDEGFVLARLDDRELRLELRQLEADLNELQKQYRKALAGLDHAEARILKAQISQAEARTDLLRQHLDRTRLIAPFPALVVSGDLSRTLGKPVERGEVLFELAPLDAYRVMIEVPDEEVGLIASGQTGSLILTAAPTQRLPIEVVNLSSAPDTVAEPGGFRVEARLLEGPSILRPGMRGLAKIEVGQRRRIWIWSHELIDWLRLRLWAWLP